MRTLWLVLAFSLLACSKPSSDSPRPPAPAPAVPDTRSQAQIDVAACTGFDGAWRCAGKKPQTFAASSTTPILPASWSVPNWFVNPQTGSDANPCTSSGSPCATKQEIVVHRWGCGQGTSNCPRFRANVTLEQDASDTDNTDPFTCTPRSRTARTSSCRAERPRPPRPPSRSTPRRTRPLARTPCSPGASPPERRPRA